MRNPPSAKGPGGSAASGTLQGAHGAAASARSAGKGFLLDLERCVGCGACVLACRIENQLPDSVSWRRILPFNLRRNPVGPTYHFSLACHHCEDPPCARGCPSGALEKRADGVVFLHEARCLGCRYCEMACPFGAPSYDAIRAVMTKCHLCAPRQDEGREPACVQACPTRALRFVQEEGVEKDRGARERERVPGFADPMEAGPNLRMVPPRDGIRGARYRELANRLAREEDSSG